MVIVNNESLVYRAIEKNRSRISIRTCWLATGLFRGTAKTVTVRRTQARSALGAAKHTHRHRTPPLVGQSVHLDLRGMGPTVM